MIIGFAELIVSLSIYELPPSNAYHVGIFILKFTDISLVIRLARKNAEWIYKTTCKLKQKSLF